MIYYELNPSQLKNITSKSPIISKNLRNVVYKISNEKLFKFQYGNYFKNIEDLTNDYSTMEAIIEQDKRTYGNSETPIQMVKKLMAKQPLIKLTTLPIGIVTINDWLIGVILKYHKNHIKLEDFIKLSLPLEREQAIYDLKNIIQELKENCIYFDLRASNILVNPVNNKLEAIDFDEIEETTVLDTKNKACEQDANERLKILIKIMKN